MGGGERNSRAILFLTYYNPSYRKYDKIVIETSSYAFQLFQLSFFAVLETLLYNYPHLITYSYMLALSRCSKEVTEMVRFIQDLHLFICWYGLKREQLMSSRKVCISSSPPTPNIQHSKTNHRKLCSMGHLFNVNT